jgi:(2Fe-2S) ferredoxin
MSPLTPEDLKRMRETRRSQPKDWIKVGMSTCGIAAGAGEVYTTLLEEVKSRNLAVEVKKTGCAGMCYGEPIVEVCKAGMPTVFYGKVDKKLALEILEKHIGQGMIVNEHVFDIPVHEKGAGAVNGE